MCQGFHPSFSSVRNVPALEEFITLLLVLDCHAETVAEGHLPEVVVLLVRWAPRRLLLLQLLLQGCLGCLVLLHLGEVLGVEGGNLLLHRRQPLLQDLRLGAVVVLVQPVLLRRQQCFSLGFLHQGGMFSLELLACLVNERFQLIPASFLIHDCLVCCRNRGLSRNGSSNPVGPQPRRGRSGQQAVLHSPASSPGRGPSQGSSAKGYSRRRVESCRRLETTCSLRDGRCNKRHAGAATHQLESGESWIASSSDGACHQVFDLGNNRRSISLVRRALHFHHKVTVVREIVNVYNCLGRG
mmetsp:Transcript_7714/g.17855  ORF Transcript_7714/g.17855 Transcript_7714/m.17855 type:complete len:298 (+) Transcript_7714:407-1300(+)